MDVVSLGGGGCLEEFWMSLVCGLDHSIANARPRYGNGGALSSNRSRYGSIEAFLHCFSGEAKHTAGLYISEEA